MIGFWLALAPSAEALTVSSIDCVQHVDNVLRYDCEVETSPGQIRLRVRDGALGFVRVTDATAEGTTHRVTVYGLEAASTYTVDVIGRDSGAFSWGLVPGSDDTFTTGDLFGMAGVAPFNQLMVRTSVRSGAVPRTSRVLTSVECGGVEAAVVFDQDGDVQWYEILDASNLSVIESSPMGGVIVDEGQRSIREITFDGQTRKTYDFGPAGECEGGLGPCPHHEVAPTFDGTYVLDATLDEVSYGSWGLSGCMTKSSYAIDGVTLLDRNWTTVLDEWTLDGDFGYDLDLDLGPNTNPAVPVPSCTSWWGGVLGAKDAPIDPIHINAFALDGDLVTASLQGWDQIAQLDLATRTVRWRLHMTDPAYSDFDVPARISPTVTENATVGMVGQHHLSWQPDGSLLMLDNKGGTHARAMGVNLNEVSGLATILRVWTLVDDDGGTYINPTPMSCPIRGSAFGIGPGRVLATCAEEAAVMELDAVDGSWAAGPAWYLEASCMFTGGPAGGFYRVLPLEDF